jgi:hypothetical protein
MSSILAKPFLIVVLLSAAQVDTAKNRAPSNPASSCSDSHDSDIQNISHTKDCQPQVQPTPVPPVITPQFLPGGMAID